MSEVIEYIPELKGIDAEIFTQNLEVNISPQEAEEVRKWALHTTYKFTD